MTAVFSGHDVRILLQARTTQLMLADGIVGLVSKGIYLAAKHRALGTADRDDFLGQLEHIVGLDDITEAIEPLRFRYEFNNSFGETRRGPMNQLIRATMDRAKADRVSRSEILLLKDYSFTFRELAPLFEMLREARNYFAHETADRDDLGWNGLLISALIRILERCNFLDRNRVEERANLKTKAKELLLGLVGETASPTNISQENPDSNVVDLTPEPPILDQEPAINQIHDIVESFSVKQGEILTTSHQVDSKLKRVSEQLKSVLEITQKIAADQLTEVVAANEKVQEMTANNHIVVVEANSDEDQENPDKDEVIVASESLISVDRLYEELQKLRDEVKVKFQNDERWRGPSSNIFQRAIITAIVVHEPISFSNVLNYDDVKWRLAKDKEFMMDQVKLFSDQVDELLSKTAWPKDYQSE